jgi:hypothetical protein
VVGCSGEVHGAAMAGSGEVHGVVSVVGVEPVAAVGFPAWLGC